MIYNLIKNKDFNLIETKASRVVPAVFRDNISTSFDHFTEQEISKVQYLNQYKESAWIYACTNAIATSVSNLPINVFRIKNKGRSNRKAIQRLLMKYGSVANLHKKLIREGNDTSINIDVKIHDVEEVVDTDLNDLLESPNKHQTKIEFFEKVLLHLELRGNSFWELVGQTDEDISDTNPPIEMFLVNPDDVLVVPSLEELIAGYLFRTATDWVPFTINQMLHIKYSDPTDDLYGQGTIEAARKNIVSDRFADKYNAAFFENGARPTGAFSTETKLHETVFERARKQLSQRYTGTSNAHKILLLEQGLTFENMSVSQKDADFIESQNLNQKKILAIFGVPPVILGLETANYATALEQNKIFWQRTVIPKTNRLAATLNKKLVPHFGEDLFVEFDFSNIEALQVDKSEQQERDFKNGFKSRNEIREEKNLPAVVGGDILFQDPKLIPIAEVGSNRDMVTDILLGEEDNIDNEV